MVTVVIPLKALARAKGRLAAELDPAARRDLAAWMLGRVVSACMAAPSIEGVLVVAGDDAAAEVAARWPVEVLVEPEEGLNRALRAADARFPPGASTLVLAGDLPLISGAEIEEVCAAAVGERAVVVGPTADGGTAALLRRPHDVIAPAYGPGSAARHIEAARAAGVEAVTVDRPGLALDVDTPGQLDAVRTTLPGAPPRQ